MTQVTTVMAPSVRWRVGLIACVIPLMVGVCVLLGYAAFDEALLAEMSQSRRGSVLRATREMTIAGVNAPLALAALYLCFETWRLSWRWVDKVAIKATPFGLQPHRSTFLQPLLWREINSVTYHRVRWSNSLVIHKRDGSRRVIRGVDNTNGAAEQFATYASSLGVSIR
jgi:hypothetical protein